MKKIRLLTGFLVFACLLAVLPTPAPAQQLHPVAEPPKNAAPLSLPLTPLGQTLQTLVGGAPAAATAPAATPDNGEDSAVQITDAFTNDLLDTLARAANALKADSAAFIATIEALPDFTEWLRHQSSDPRRVILWNAISDDLLIIVGVPFLIGIALSLLLTPLRLSLKRRTPQALPGRVGLLLGLFMARLAPLLVFMGLSLILLQQNESHSLPRFVILNVIYALSAGYTIVQALRGFFAPGAPRPFSLAEHQADYAKRWLIAFSLIIISDYFFVTIMGVLRPPASFLTIFQDLCALILTVMTVTVIFRTRSIVNAILRGETEEGSQNFGPALRLALARHWHALATIYLVAGLIVIWLGIEDGIALMLRGTILTTLVLTAARLCFIILDRWASPGADGIALIHRQILSILLRPALWAATGFGICMAWGVRFDSYAATPAGQHTTAAVLSIALTLFVLTVLYEMLNASVERKLNNRDKKKPAASARTRTLLPMVRHSVFILFSGIAILISLSAIGFDIGPLLAGAGVVGVAIGFGSQTLVKDFLTGLFIVVENTVAVGDVVKIGEFSGVVEALNVRTIRLRDSDGSLHIMPFSEVSKITNMTRGFGFALVDIGVAYDSDLEHVMNVLREIGAQIQEDAVFKRVILEPIEVLGVENLGDSSITIRARIRTRPGKQWDVRRLLLLRIKQRFDKEGIEIPFPTVTQHITAKKD